ncbi:MAG: dihydrolipoyl dehydrogenase, partial [Bacteroidota bacterium]
MADQKYDVVVIGSGPGGYVAAIRCAQLGMNVAIVERYNTLGGTCLNVGCIPSKAMLDSSHHYHDAVHKFVDHGIKVDPKLDFGKMVQRKRDVVEGITKGVAFLMKKNKIEVVTGHATIKDKNTVEVAGEKDKQTLSADKIVIATGSKPATIPGVEIDKKRVISSTEALEMKEVPKRLLIIGAGYIGLEMGSVYARLGSKVTVVEYADRSLPAMDKDISREVTRVLKKELDFEFHFKTKVTGVKGTAKQVTLKAEDKDGKEVEMRADYCLVAVGRKPYTENLGLENVGVETDDRGFVKVDKNFKTNVDNIYAFGDVIGGKMLAHKASEEGIALAEMLAGHSAHIDYNKIPGVVYMWPEVSSVGYTEEELKDQGTPYNKGKFPFKAIGRASASGDDNGFVKILAHKETDE